MVLVVVQPYISKSVYLTALNEENNKKLAFLQSSYSSSSTGYGFVSLFLFFKVYTILHSTL